MVSPMARPKKYPKGRVMISITIGPEAREELDRRKGHKSRGEFIEWLLEVTRDLEPPWAPKREGSGESHGKTHSNVRPKGAGSP